MDLDVASRKVLTLLRQRVTIVVGDNLPRLAQSLALTPEQFAACGRRLTALGLAEDEPLADGYRRLAITDPGIAFLQR